MKKYTTQIIVGIVAVAIIVVYVISQKGSSSNVASNERANPTVPTSTSTLPVATVPTPPTTPVSPTTPTPPATGGAAPLYKDGSYTGDVANAFYGNLQVQATISGGKITDVEELQAPNGNANSIRINSSAIISLRSEAIAAQSAQVDVVSGATQSSEAFVESLGVALGQAKV